ELAAAIRGAGGESSDEAYRQFRYRRAGWQRELVVRRLAQFWGAFDGQTLVASLGLVQLGRLGRYQDVKTAPAYRRRGIASALLAAAARAMQPSGLDDLVIQTLVDNSAAARVYQRAGFRTIERTVTAYRRQAR
ncbi:MAG TPA: GNAT family N-acetyltransferase, partial [Kofleriaceae bacterium]